MFLVRTTALTGRALALPALSRSAHRLSIRAYSHPASLDQEAASTDPIIRDIVEKISKLNILQVSELNTELKRALKISEVPMMAMGAPSAAAPAAAAAPAEQAEEKKEEKTEFNIRLTKFTEADKVKLIKEVKNLKSGFNLIQAKKFVESLPQMLLEKQKKEDAEKFKALLEAAGGTVELL